MLIRVKKLRAEERRGEESDIITIHEPKYPFVLSLVYLRGFTFLSFNPTCSRAARRPQLKKPTSKATVYWSTMSPSALRGRLRVRAVSAYSAAGGGVGS